LEAVAGDLLARGASRVESIACDLADAASHEALWASIEQRMPNFTSAASLLSYAAASLERKKSGVLAVITSVAGDRARRSNYVYGSAKGALTLFVQGLRARLFVSGVRVLTIKPGPVDTPMIAHMKKGLLTASPKTVGATIYREMEDGKAEVIYVPAYWRAIMAVVRAIPESVGKKLKF
jgi:short-subunit dehydrogenase